jgi:hypothetical protein
MDTSAPIIIPTTGKKGTIPLGSYIIVLPRGRMVINFIAEIRRFIHIDINSLIVKLVPL